uniref:Polymeric immunoglobulin receptor n=1 Tax=Calidris pygmaea TaxID=425635 RepID=A0A8C3KRB6_9CHAR
MLLFGVQCYYAISPPGPIELIRGELHGSVTILCPPGDTQGGEKRFWCKLGRTSCALIADSDGYVGRNYRGRILITPQESSGAFKILINDLKKEDLGLYKCGTGRLSGWDSQRMGNYEKKYLCRWTDARCSLLVDTEGFVHELYKGRIQIASSHQENGTYTVVMRHLREEDEGWYCWQWALTGVSICIGPHVPEGADLFYVKLHSTLTVVCSFGKEYVSYRKYLCKMEKSRCQNVVDSHRKYGEDYVGRVMLTNTEPEGSFSVTITQMGWEDSGLYVCGAGIYEESGVSKQLDVHVYEESKVPQGKPTIFGVKGSSVTFECRYEPLSRSSLKYLCKWRDTNGCSKIIGNDGYVSSLYEGRVAMYNNPQNNTYTVILNQLKNSDEGYYWCMTNKDNEQQSSTELKIIDGQPGLQGKKEVEVQEGSRVDLTCSYPCKYYSYQKYWCKWNNTGCTPMLASDQRQTGMDVGCDTDNKTVILSFDSVAKTDQGWYWCGVKHNGLYGETMAVYLTVTGGELQGKGGRDLVSPPGPIHMAPTLSGEGARAETETTPLGALGAALLGVSLHGGGWDADALTPVPCRVFISSLFTDLVSVGSYRTNISMSDFESVKDYSASNNAFVPLTRSACITPKHSWSPGAARLNAALSPSSKEDADLAYSAFLLTSNGIAQGGSGEGNAAPDVSPPNWEGQM